MKVLVDTSIWIHHLRHGDAALASALQEGNVLTHPFVIGELACGTLRRRAEILRLPGELPQAYPPHWPAPLLHHMRPRHDAAPPHPGST